MIIRIMKVPSFLIVNSAVCNTTLAEVRCDDLKEKIKSGQNYISEVKGSKVHPFIWREKNPPKNPQQNK